MDNTIVTNPFQEPKHYETYTLYKLKADRDTNEGHSYLNQTYPTGLEYKWKQYGRTFVVYSIV
jgi:hypothetical protein